MPPAEGFLTTAFSGLNRSLTSTSSPSHQYDQVNLSDNSSAVVGTVVHQHFYPSKYDAAIAGENGQDQAIELRGTSL